MKRRETGFINKSLIINTLIFTLIICGLLFFSGFAGISLAVESQCFVQGVNIDGMDVSGMTYGQAEKAVSSHSKQMLEDVDITLVYNGMETVLSADVLGISLNDEETLELAYAYNRNQTDSMAQRYNKTVMLAQGMNFESHFTVDLQLLQAAIDEYADNYNLTPTDATAIFNKDSCTFTYSSEITGIKIDTNKIISDILGMLKEKCFQVIKVEASVLNPLISEAMLRDSTVLICEYSTVASKNNNRDINIQLMCNAVNGFELKPGEVLSLNQLVGKRTEDKGFVPAPAIENGLIVDDIGGGICQLAGTLYNAALLGNMQIVERVRHTWPSDYLPIGQDSTLNWDNKDLKIRNTSDYSIYIHAVMKDRNVTVQLYGQPLEDGMTIEVETEILKTIKPDNAEIRYTSKLPNGVEQTAREAKPGYEVNVYRLYLMNGQVQKKELVSHDVYPAIKKIVYIGKNTNNK